MDDFIGKKLGQYELLELIGKGGMATVYRARQPSMDRDVAIKLLEPQLTTSQEFLKRFLRETRAVAQMSHAHIVKVYDFGEQEGNVYLAMELLRGGSLADQIAAGAMPLPLTRRVLDQVSSALDYAHAKGVIHRDLKPQNILFDDAGNAFLTDFGIIKVMDETSKITETGSVVGTPAYISPEQWTGRPLDGRSDVYALGVVLYEMLTGNVPFQGETLYSMMQLHLNELPAPVHTVRKELSPRYAQILDKALAKNPELRYSKAGDVAAAFAEAASAPAAGPAATPARSVHETAPVPRQSTRSMPPMEPGDDRTSAFPVEMDDGRTGAIPMPSMQSGSVYETTPLPVGSSVPRPRPAAPTVAPAATRKAPPPRETGGRSRLPLIIGALAVIGIVVVGALLLASRGSETTSPTPTTGAALAASQTSPPPSETPVPTTEAAPATATSESVVILTTQEATEPPTEAATETSAATATEAPTQTPAATATETAIPATATPSDLIAVLASPTPTSTVTPSVTVTNTPTLTLTPTATVKITNTPPPSLTPTATGTATALPSATFTPNPQQTATANALATAQQIGADVSAVIRTGQQAFGPDSGQLAHPPGSSLAEEAASASLIDFVAEARFVNPYGADQGDWDYGFIFRAADADTQYRLFVRSKGDYALVLRERGEVSLVQNEPVANLDVAEGEFNVLRLAVEGDEGFLFVNGQLAAQLDLSALGGPGDVAVATAFLAESRIAGRATRFEDFTIWIPRVG